jgi:hypothetical protein
VLVSLQELGASQWYTRRDWAESVDDLLSKLQRVGPLSLAYW